MSVMIHEILASVPGKSDDFGTLNAAAEEALELIESEFSKRGTLHAQTLDAESGLRVRQFQIPVCHQSPPVLRSVRTRPDIRALPVVRFTTIRSPEIVLGP